MKTKRKYDPEYMKKYNAIHSQKRSMEKKIKRLEEKQGNENPPKRINVARKHL